MLDLYKVDMKYIRNLMNVDHKNVLSVSSQNHKNNRLFVGIIVVLGNHKYCIPLSSVEGKAKYEKMSENITLRKIRDSEENLIGILNLNNMIPVRDEYIKKVDVFNLPEKTESQKKYKKKCIAEYKWINSANNENDICQLAKELYRMYISGQPFKKKSICANFPALEKECDKAKHTKAKIIEKRNKK